MISRAGWIAILGLCACGDSGPPSGPDAAAQPMVDADPGSPGVDAAPSPDADPAAGGGTLTGTITRSAAPAAGGVGHIYIAVFTRDPVTDRDNAEAVAFHRVDNADMSASNASITYTIEEIPPRSEPFYVTAFLDDNGNAGDDPMTAGPDRGDLIALEGLASPTVTIATETTVTLDLVLNFNLPF